MEVLEFAKATTENRSTLSPSCSPDFALHPMISIPRQLKKQSCFFGKILHGDCEAKIFGPLTQGTNTAGYPHGIITSVSKSPAESDILSKSRTFSSIAEPLVAAATLYLCIAYILLPLGWRVFIDRHPALSDLPFITSTSDGHPGDPINLALGGSKAQLERIMKRAGWFPADPLSLRSDVEIAEATVLGRPYKDAPVSSLFLWGRKEDLAFEQPVGNNPRERHHIRFWKSDKLDTAGNPLWAGSVTYDKRVGLSHTTGQITHHIDGDIDAERDRLFNQLIATGMLIDTKYRDDFHKQKSGYNGGGDPWHTDGKLALGQISD